LHFCSCLFWKVKWNINLKCLMMSREMMSIQLAVCHDSVTFHYYILILYCLCMYQELLVLLGAPSIVACQPTMVLPL